MEKAWRILASLRDHGTIRLRKKKHKVNFKKNIYNLKHLFWSPMYTQLVWGERVWYYLVDNSYWIFGGINGKYPYKQAFIYTKVCILQMRSNKLKKILVTLCIHVYWKTWVYKTCQLWKIMIPTKFMLARDDYFSSSQNGFQHELFKSLLDGCEPQQLLSELFMKTWSDNFMSTTELTVIEESCCFCREVIRSCLCGCEKRVWFCDLDSGTTNLIMCGGWSDVTSFQMGFPIEPPK